MGPTKRNRPGRQIASHAVDRVTHCRAQRGEQEHGGGGDQRVSIADGEWFAMKPRRVGPAPGFFVRDHQRPPIASSSSPKK